jgi:hypothetical protein
LHVFAAGSGASPLEHFMTDLKNPLAAIAAQLMNSEQVTVNDHTFPVERVALRMAQFQLKWPLAGSYRAKSRQTQPLGKASARKTSGRPVPRRETRQIHSRISRWRGARVRKDVKDKDLKTKKMMKAKI